MVVLLASAGARAGGFAGVEWGASKAEVLAAETHQMHHNMDKEIAYWNFTFGGVEAGLVYEFDSGKLVCALRVAT